MTDTQPSRIIQSPSRKITESSTSISGPEWVKIGNISLKEEERRILYSPTEWINDRINDAAMNLIKNQFPHIWGVRKLP